MVKWLLVIGLVCLSAFGQNSEGEPNRSPSSWTGQLTDSTNPKPTVKSLTECLKKIDTTGDRSPGQVKLDNDRVAQCIRTRPEEFRVESEYSVCARGVGRIKDNSTLKSEVSLFCKDHYATTMECVKSLSKIKEIKTKQSKTKECVSKNYSHFEPSFCMKLLADAQLDRDQDLISTCRDKAERLPPHIIQKDRSGQK